MIMQPEYITEEMVALAKEEVGHKKNSPALPLVRFTSFREGRAAQTVSKQYLL